MRWMLLAACVALAGCQTAETRADRARGICAQNGHAMGSPGFDACFRDTFTAMNVAISGSR